ncbi:MAG: hypothetical protein ABIQ49_07120 [Gemmatimonadales bacterium]
MESSIRELEFQSEIAELVGADVLVVHGGGMAGGVPAALTPGMRRRAADPPSPE